MSFFRVVTISACAQSHPASIALRYVQRRILMSDPNWNKGFYYDGPYPRLGMKHARLVKVLFQPYVHYFTSFLFIVRQGEAWCLEKAKQIKPTLQTCLVLHALEVTCCVLLNCWVLRFIFHLKGLSAKNFVLAVAILFELGVCCGQILGNVRRLDAMNKIMVKCSLHKTAVHIKLDTFRAFYSICFGQKTSPAFLSGTRATG